MAQLWQLRLGKTGVYKHLCTITGMPEKEINMSDFSWEGLIDVYTYFANFFDAVNEHFNTTISCVDVLPPTDETAIRPIVACTEDELKTILAGIQCGEISYMPYKK